MTSTFAVYILTNPRHTVLYIGMTSDLLRRITEHREKLVPGFTSRYNVTKLVYFELHDGPNAAIEREKQLKDGPRRKKVSLIEANNPEWRDLYPDLQED